MRVLLLGDSQMSGISRSLIPKLQRAGHEVVGTGIRVGYSTQRFVDADVAVPRADLVIVALGGNDEPRNEDAYKETLSRFFVKYTRSPVRLIWWGPAHSLDAEVQLKHNRTANMQRSIFAQARPRPGDKVEWHDSRTVTAGLEHAPDGVHFTAAGYRKWADSVMRSVSGSSWFTWGLIAVSVGVGIPLFRRWYGDGS